MAEQPGFLGTLGISAVDERDVVQAQRDALATQQQQRMKALGAQTGRGVAGLIGGAVGAARGQGFGASAQRAHASATDSDVARQTGITVEQLQARRKIRRLTSDNPSDPSFEGRSKLLREIITILNQAGDTELVGNALRQLSAIKTEAIEFDKLKAVKRTEVARAKVNEEAADQAGVIDAFKNGEPVTGQFYRNAEGIPGMEINGIFSPFSETLTQTDPNKAFGKQRSITRILRDDLGQKDFNLLTTSLIANRGLAQRYDRVLSSVRDFAQQGRATAVLSGAGSISGFVDRAFRAVTGVIETVIPSKVRNKDASLRQSWTARVESGQLNDMIQLPGDIAPNAAAAQVYRAQIMDLAYIIARAAEPSNRGLSDNDIQNALVKLGSASGNPQLLMERSFEIIIDGTLEVDARLSAHYNGRHRDDRNNPITNAQIDVALGGGLLPEYRAAIDSMYRKFDVTVDPAGRPIFGTPLDTGSGNFAVNDPLGGFTQGQLDEATDFFLSTQEDE